MAGISTQGLGVDLQAHKLTILRCAQARTEYLNDPMRRPQQEVVPVALLVARGLRGGATRSDTNALERCVPHVLPQ